LRAWRPSQGPGIAELGGLAPADIGQGFDRLPERRQLVARAAGIMGDDGVLDIDGVLQVPQHAVRLSGASLWVSFGIHFASPLLVRGRYFGGDRARVAIRGDALADLFQQRIEHQPGVADRPIFASTSLLRWLGSIVEWMMVLPFGIAMPNEVSVNEQPIPKITSGLGEELWHRARHGEAAGASDSGCVSGNDDLPPRLVVTGNCEPFGEAFQLRPRFGVMHALAGINHRPLGAINSAAASFTCTGSAP